MPENEVGIFETVVDTLIRPTIKGVLRDELQDLLTSLNEAQNSEELLDVHQAMEILGICRATLSAYVREGVVPAYRLGKSLRFKRSELENSLEQIRARKYSRAG